MPISKWMGFALVTTAAVLSVSTWSTAHAKDLDLVKFTEEEVAESGAVCLDGTPPAYYIRKGTGEGKNKWAIYLVGGGWCFFERFSVLGPAMEWMGCYERSKISFIENNSTTGSSRDLPPTIPGSSVGGLFSEDPEKNVHFHNWNHIYVVYCDGFSFAGNREEPLDVKGTKVYLRGRRILDAVLERLTYKEGMQVASDVILTGCSSGGLGVYINADHVQGYLEQNLHPGFKYKALADGGYFMDVEWEPLSFSPIDLPSFKDLLYIGAQMHNAVDSLNPSCRRVEWFRKWKCVIPRYFYEYIKTPVFVLNPFYDSYQVYMIKGLFCLPPHCTEEQMPTFLENRDTFIEKSDPIFNSKHSGAFINSCVIHCQALQDELWKTYKINMANGFTYSVEDTFAHWYFDQGSCDGGKSKLVVYDTKPWPHNRSCPKTKSSFYDDTARLLY